MSNNMSASVRGSNYRSYASLFSVREYVGATTLYFTGTTNFYSMPDGIPDVILGVDFIKNDNNRATFKLSTEVGIRHIEMQRFGQDYKINSEFTDFRIVPQFKFNRILVKFLSDAYFIWYDKHPERVQFIYQAEGETLYTISSVSGGSSHTYDTTITHTKPNSAPYTIRVQGANYRYNIYYVYFEVYTWYVPD